MLYEELLEISKPRFDRFLEHVARFEGMFTWGDLQQRCYEAMYVCNDPADPAAVKALKEEIPELRDLCSSCAAFYIPARNKSIPKYDVLLGKQYEDVLMEFLEKKLGAPVVRADLEDRRMPDCKLLRPDGSAAAYFEVKFHGAPFVLAKNETGRYCYEGSATLDLEKVRRQLQLVDEGLDAPVFYVHWLEYPCLKGVFYETAEQVRAYLQARDAEFSRQRRAGDDQKSRQAVYLQKVYPPLLQMGSFEEFVETLRQLLQTEAGQEA